MKKRAILIILLSGALLFPACGLAVKKIPPGTIINRTPDDHFIKIGDANLHYREYPGRGPIVFMQHGYASSTYSWEKIAPVMNARGYHVYALDLKGSGWSDKPVNGDYSPIVLKEEINSFMEAMNMKDVIYVGNSLGGALGLMMAIDHPEKIGKLILLDPGGYPTKMPSTLTMAANHGSAFFGGIIFGRWMVESNLKQVFYDKKRLTDEQIDAYYDRLRTQDALKSLELLSRAIDYGLFEKYKDRIPSIRQPTLLIWGRDDRWIPVSIGYKFRGDLRDSKLVIIPECGHAPQEEVPDLTARYILDFLDGKPVPDAPAAEAGGATK
jgi:pimeloyl-ACP methyl ester carboxylesterase